ncbi:DUF2934 domain-containing protein [Rhizosaccharibacter radicis]|uniref:DUF2934 domain-containing protein n=1 Tax=Rhizosaccharibacter radicis TaxID=2782605 RepID=A0ABT1VWS6_9PROT|nr:DUF2934 domain-containing protein [Acetobacteraceae bacterium KSS12]
MATPDERATGAERVLRCATVLPVKRLHPAWMAGSDSELGTPSTSRAPARMGLKMSENPLSNDPAREEKIRERAYHLWQAAGEPHGRHDEFWEQARELVGMEESAGSGQLPNPSSVPGADPNRSEPVEEAFIQENLGEFPDRFADQGEAQPTPKAPVRKARNKAAADPSIAEPPTGASGPAANRRSPPAGKAAPPKAASAPKPVATSKVAPEPKAVPKKAPLSKK